MKKGTHHVGGGKSITKKRLLNYSRMQRDAEELAILEGVQRIADLASGKVKGLSEREWKEEARRRLAEIEPGTAKALAGKQVSALIKKNIKAAIAEAVVMNDKFMPAAAFIRNELILRGVTFLKGLVQQSNEKQLRKLRDQKTEAEFFAALTKVMERDLLYRPAAADRRASWFILEYGWRVVEPEKACPAPYSWFALVVDGKILHETYAQNALDARRKLLQSRGNLPEGADILPSDGHKQLRPYFARRNCSKGFEKLDASGKTGRGTDATKTISEDREDRGDQVMRAPELPVKRGLKLRNMPPPPPLHAVETQQEAAAKHKRDVGRRRKK